MIVKYLWLLGLGFCTIQALLLAFKIDIKESLIRKGMVFYSLSAVSLSFLTLVFWYLRQEPIHEVLPAWFEYQGYEFEISILLDPLSIWYGLVAQTLFAVVVRFSFEYLHRDAGYQRFFWLISLLSLGLSLITYSGNFDTLAIGWEMVGLSSVFLIAYFNKQSRAVENSVRALIYYRICDISLLLASAWIHHSFHTNDFNEIAQHPNALAALGIGILVIGATLAKSAQLPMTPWLYRAMEGPSSSSAIFYGALSIHLGPFLLLRLAPLFESHLPLKMLIFSVGATTAIYSSLVGATRSDAKTLLSYSTLNQVSLMYCEIALGLHSLALFHLISHASLRTWQFLRASSLIQDFHDHPKVVFLMKLKRIPSVVLPFSEKTQKKIYVHAMNSFYLDAVERIIVQKILNIFRMLQKFEKGNTNESQ